MDKKILGERVQLIRKALKLNQKDFAEPVGIKQSTLSGIESGNSMLTDAVKQLIIYRYSINQIWLETGQGSMFMDDGRLPPSGRIVDIRKVPVLGQVPAGFPNLINEEVIEYISLPNIPDDCYALKVKGISMRPVIEDGDYVLFVINQEIRSGDMVIVNDEWGESMVKWYREKGGNQYLISENKDYKPIEPNDNYRIVGRVVQCLRTWKP